MENNNQTVKTGLWSPDEDQKLENYIRTNGHGCWTTLPQRAGLQRCGKSCRMRWMNYLRPGVKRGDFSPEEVGLIVNLQARLGNKWAQIAKHLPGRTDNDVKNFWNLSTRKKLIANRALPIPQNPVLPQIPPNYNIMPVPIFPQTIPSAPPFPITSFPPQNPSYIPNNYNQAHIYPQPMTSGPPQNPSFPKVNYNQVPMFPLPLTSAPPFLNDSLPPQNPSQAFPQEFNQSWPSFQPLPSSVSDDQIPTFGDQVLAGDYQIPAGDYQISAGDYQIPAGDYQISTGDYQISTDDYQIPADGDHIPAPEVVEHGGGDIPAGDNTQITVDDYFPYAESFESIFSVVEPK